MIIYPAIDIKDGRCVRLMQGDKDRETVYSHDPVEIARNGKEEALNFTHRGFGRGI